MTVLAVVTILALLNSFVTLALVYWAIRERGERLGTDDMVAATLATLVRKGVITRDEFQKMVDGVNEGVIDEWRS